MNVKHTLHNVKQTLQFRTASDANGVRPPANRSPATMDTVVTEFQRSLDEIRQEGHAEGQVAMLVQQIRRKFGRRTAEEVQRLIVESPGRDRIALVAAAILECDTSEELLARVRED